MLKIDDVTKYQSQLQSDFDELQKTYSETQQQIAALKDKGLEIEQRLLLLRGAIMATNDLIENENADNSSESESKNNDDKKSDK